MRPVYSSLQSLTGTLDASAFRAANLVATIDIAGGKCAKQQYYDYSEDFHRIFSSVVLLTYVGKQGTSSSPAVPTVGGSERGCCETGDEKPTASGEDGLVGAVVGRVGP